MQTHLVLATANPHKVEELAAILRDLPVRILTLTDATNGRPPPEPAETGSTFEDNARIKASAYAKATGSPCLADDSGLEIDALRGRPGVISSHYGTDGRETGLTRAQRDRLNNERVMREMNGVPEDRRTARFVCAMTLCSPEGTVRTVARGVFEGRIGTPERVPRGENGFGYDPLFLVGPDFVRTSAELTPDEKNRLSHRAAAARQFAAWLRTNVL